jgi:hypothetical protein
MMKSETRHYLEILASVASWVAILLALMTTVGCMGLAKYGTLRGDHILLTTVLDIPAITGLAWLIYINRNREASDAD